MLTRLALDELCSLYQLLFATTSAGLGQIYSTVHDRVGHGVLLPNYALLGSPWRLYINVFRTQHVRRAHEDCLIRLDTLYIAKRRMMAARYWVNASVVP